MHSFAYRPSEQALTVVEAQAITTQPLSVDDVVAQVQAVQQVMSRVMKKDEHYGTIPGTDKPTLLKPGAEKLSLMFRLAPSYDIDRRENGEHREYETVCTLTHIESGRTIGQGVGICSTKESKYRYVNSERVCPQCNQPTIIKGKEEYGGGWLCWKKRGGCGATFPEDAKEIAGQKVGKKERDDLADVYNTVLKMSKKRAHVDAVLTATAASDIFAQDLEDLPGDAINGHSRPVPPPPVEHTEPPPPEHPPGPKMITDKQRGLIYALAEGLALSPDDMKGLMGQRYQVDSSTKLTTKTASDLIDYLQSLRTGPADAAQGDEGDPWDD